MIDQVRQILAVLDIKGHYLDHSFRRGATISVKEAGLFNDKIILLDR